jgi:peptidoglycan/xylan/chitin deacetylase (PgdA/CDA1 family)
MRIPGLKTTRQLVRQLRSRFLGGSIILGYHRLSEEARDPFSLSVSPQNFASHLNLIRTLATPISLSELVQRLREGNPPRRAVALTMDDGYADNLHQARPLLERYQIPATIFVVSGCLGREFWWDELARLVFTQGAFANGIRLAIAGQEVKWQIQADKDIQAQQERLLQILYWALRPLPEPERQNIIKELRSKVGNVQVEECQHRALTPAELRTLADSPLIEIGSHTHTHPALALLTDTGQRYEIEYSQARLAEITGRAVTGFSFPNGSYSAATQEILRSLAYTYACSSHQDTAHHAGQRYQLPRLWVPDLGGDSFEHWLRRWLAVGLERKQQV